LEAKKTMANSSRIGKAGESLAAGVLGRLGVHMVEEIATPFVVMKTRMIGGVPWIRIRWKKKVSADHTGLLSDGRRVLAEVKTVEHNLRWSDFSTHQPERLSMNVEWNGISLVVWVHSTGVKVLKWPIFGFKPGKGITPERADEMSIETEAQLHGLV
jgi:hypothetical protein